MSAFDEMENSTNFTRFHRCHEAGTCYTLDATNWLGPITMVKPIYGFIMPILIMITIMSNSLIIIVLSRRHMRSPTNVVLMGMAVCDLLTVIFPAPWYVYLYTMGYHDRFDWSLLSCYTFEFMMETSPQIFHTASNWLTLALAVQRYIYVCHPSTAKEMCTVGKSQIIVLGTVGVSGLHMICRMMDRTYFVEMVETPHGLLGSCTVEFADWLHTVSLDVYFLSFFWFRVLFVHLIPCVVLVILNSCLFSAMKRAERRRNNLMPGRIRRVGPDGAMSREQHRQRDANSTTMMLVVVIAVFLSVEIPLMVITALHTISSSMYEFMNYELAKKIILMINVCICMSYPINFGIYCGMSRQFRETFSQLFIEPLQQASCCPHLKHQENNLSGAQSRNLMKSNQTLATCTPTVNNRTQHNTRTRTDTIRIDDRQNRIADTRV